MLDKIMGNVVDIPKVSEEKIVGIIHNLAKEYDTDTKKVMLLMKIENGKLAVYPNINGQYKEPQSVKQLLT